MYIDHVDAVEQVFTEITDRDLLFQVAVGGKNKADIYLFICLPANAAELAVLQDLKQLGLDARIEFPDFIEEECAAIGQFDASGFGSHGAGESALFMTEQLALLQCPLNGGVVDLHKW